MRHARISPTALYTAAVWNIHNRSFPELENPQGKLLFTALEPAMRLSAKVGGPQLVDFLLARHDLIDAQINAHLLQHGTATIVEIAAGMSPRGMRYVRRHGDAVTYIEADLPHMAQAKSARIARHLKAHANHSVVPVDAFAESGPQSLPELFAGLPAGQPVVVVTEGLLNYFDRPRVEQLFAQLARQFASRPGSVYVSDIHLQAQNQGLMADAFKTALGVFVRGRVHLHYQNPQELITAAAARGLQLKLLKPSEFSAQFESCRAVGADFASILVARVL